MLTYKVLAVASVSRFGPKDLHGRRLLRPSQGRGRGFSAELCCTRGKVVPGEHWARKPVSEDMFTSHIPLF